MREFALPRLWLSGGIAGLLLLVWFSLTPVPFMLPVAQGDKLEHLLSYAVLGGYAGALFASRRVQVLSVLGLIALGVLIEWLQGLTSYRLADPYDALANAVGALLGMVLVLTTALGRSLQRGDAWLSAVRQDS